MRRYLTFELLVDYRITAFDDQGLGLEILGLQTQSFYPGLGLNVDYRVDEPGTIAPDYVSYQPIGSVVSTPNSVYFDFGSDGLMSGDTSRWMFVGAQHMCTPILI